MDWSQPTAIVVGNELRYELFLVYVSFVEFTLHLEILKTKHSVTRLCFPLYFSTPLFFKAHFLWKHLLDLLTSFAMRYFESLLLQKEYICSPVYRILG
jgi:hypothetical protein